MKNKSFFNKKSSKKNKEFTNNKYSNDEKEFVLLTEKEQASNLFFSIIIGAMSFSIISGGIVLLNAMTYNPSENVTVDVSSVDTFKSFAEGTDLSVYEDVILKHNNETQNKALDIKRVSSDIGREYPFTTILNKYNNNNSTKLCKFIYTELKPAIISYKLANGGALPTEDTMPDKDNFYTVNLDSLSVLLNIRDASLSGYTYKVKDAANNSNIQIKVFDGESEYPVKLFDISQFRIKNISTDQVSLNYNEENLILQIKEEFNNVRLDKIVFTEKEKYIILVDTLTNKQVKIKRA